MPSGNANQNASQLTRWHEGVECCDSEWEAAYEAFETSDQEIAKFTARFRKLGVDRLPHDLHVVDLFCGRGNGLRALEQLGFVNLEGVDLSPTLLEHYRGPARLYVGDCRHLKFPAASKDLVIVQGGLHHLPTLPADLTCVLAETQRVLRTGGRLVIVEPWLTPFLRVVHAACRVDPLRRCWRKLDALATMIDREAGTYFHWLKQPDVIEDCLDQYFQRERRIASFGKLMYVGLK